MSSFINTILRSFPFAIGVVLVLTSLAYLAEFSGQIYGLNNFDDEEFLAFLVFALIGIPVLIYGIDVLSSEKSQKNRNEINSSPNIKKNAHRMTCDLCGVDIKINWGNPNQKLCKKCADSNVASARET